MIQLLCDNKKSSKLERIRQSAKSKKGIINISGLSEERSAPIISFISRESGKACFIMTSSYGKAKKLYEDLLFFSMQNIFLLPEEEKFFLKYDAKSHSALEEKIKAITAMVQGEPCIVIGSVTSILKKMIPKEAFFNNILDVELDKEYEIADLNQRLAIMGYERTELVETKGQYSVRGGIVDVYPLNERYPIRVEFFDTQVDSVRSFDPDSQRSIENLERIQIFPAELMIFQEEEGEKALKKIKADYEAQKKRVNEDAQKKLTQKQGQLSEYIQTLTNRQILENYIPYFYEKPQTILDYFQNDAIVIAQDYNRIEERLRAYEQELKEDFQTLMERGEVVPADYNSFLGEQEIHNMYTQGLSYLFTPFVGTLKGLDAIDAMINIPSKPVTNFYGKMDFFLEEIKRYIKFGYKIGIVCSGNERMKNLKGFLERSEVPLGRITFEEGQLSAGTELVEEKIVFISDADIFNNLKIKKTKAQKKNAKPIKSFADIRQGDFVVHENHGIGKFLGIEQLVIADIKKDYLKIKYAGEDMLYVPVDQMDIVQKYIGAEEGTPKVNKLSSPEWKKTKAKVKAAIEEMARELLELNAQRRTLKGYAFEPDTPWQSEFEEMFPYEETDDQLRSIVEIKKDMEKDEPMDRLLCGDVGYGKTEVAARAVFKCIADGKQAAILVPTTILANQHYHTFKERMEHFPFKVEVLSRFRTESQQGEILRKLKNGSVDVVVGTHRLISKDVEFKDLGLLIIDEEQRFGVQHKEAIKMLRKNVDVLTLSATPIPRTLHMSLIGVRNMSLIEEPPEERYPVQTYVMEQDNGVLRDVILREIERDGQVFVVYNKVRGIKKFASEIAALVPEAKVAVGHGQMVEKELENVIINFMENESNVLVCTTIIETGIDIPNANTMIIIDADHFGLSQLYQLRGRVGRSNRIAYAYLFYQTNKVLTEVAEKRLKSIKEFTEFGSGFRIAMRDLEIRGAGNLLGTQQHGHMSMIGYELYCKILDDTVRLLSKGEGALEGSSMEETPQETTIEIEVSAYISNEYIANEVMKVEVYKKIAAIRTAQDQGEVVDELLDRFGDIPKETDNLIEIAMMKARAEKLGIETIKEQNGKILLEFHEKNQLKAQGIAELVRVFGLKVFVNAGKKPFVRYEISKRMHLLAEIQKVLEVLYLAV